MRALRQGSVGSHVRVWQQLLRGIDATITVDGDFGPETERVTSEFQRRVGLPDDGVVNAATRTAMSDLIEWLTAKPQRATVGIGARGDDVRAAQRLLNRHGARVPIDGVFRASTAAAAKAFQRRNRLPATGIIDPATWAVLD